MINDICINNLQRNTVEDIEDILVASQSAPETHHNSDILFEESLSELSEDESQNLLLTNSNPRSFHLSPITITEPNLNPSRSNLPESNTPIPMNHLPTRTPAEIVNRNDSNIHGPRNSLDHNDNTPTNESNYKDRSRRRANRGRQRRVRVAQPHMVIF